MRWLEVLNEASSDRYMQMLNGLHIRLDDGRLWLLPQADIAGYVKKTRAALKRQDRIVWAMRVFRAMLAAEMLDLVRESLSGGNPDPAVYKYANRDATFGGAAPLREQPHLEKLAAELTEIGAYKALPALNRYRHIAQAPLKPKGRTGTDEERRRWAEQGREHALRYADDTHLAYAGMDELLGKISHFLGVGESYADRLPHNAIVTYQFERQPIPDVLKAMRKEELRLQKLFTAREGAMGKPIITFPDGAEWVDLGRAFCPAEAKAMGHCGNAPAKDSDQTLLSLRVPETTEGITRKVVALTFVLHADGSLGEMKGYKNSKPKTIYHDYIVALLNHPRIKAVKGGHWMPEHDFHLRDLSPKHMAKLEGDKRWWVERPPIPPSFREVPPPTGFPRWDVFVHESPNGRVKLIRVDENLWALTAISDYNKPNDMYDRVNSVTLPAREMMEFINKHADKNPRLFRRIVQQAAMDQHRGQ